jgi:hypothetical protein
MNRQECEEMVKGPGKFEAEPVYLPYFYDMAMEGMEDDREWDGETEISVFQVTKEDRAMFPELADVKTVRLWVSDTGFCYTESM